MTEPTDHRVEAERWLAKVEKGQQADTAAAHALIAIAHDLHRIADALEPVAGLRITPPHPDDVGTKSWRARYSNRDDQPGPGNVEADFTEDGQPIGACDATDRNGARCLWPVRHGNTAHRFPTTVTGNWVTT